MEKWRQKLHLEPPDGWLNDPNGLCFFDGKYHIYFQHSPGSPQGKTLRRWGHYSGQNLTNLEYNGDVLVPEIPEEKDGVYSGSSVSYNGVLHIFYTGNVKYDGDYDYINNGRGANVIHVTSKDGYNMSAKQVVLRNSDYPEFCSCHVRDPKVWRGNDTWKMVLGARTKDGRGGVLVFKSDDLEKWVYSDFISVPNFGYMWECPDYFEIGGKKFLSASPQGLEHFETKYQNLFQSGYFPVDGTSENSKLGEFTEWDMGFDFYAPQTFAAPDGRIIMLAWMGIDYDAYVNPTTALGWQHCLTLPRELTVNENGKLLQNPIRELLELRSGKISLKSGEKCAFELPFELSGTVDASFSISFDSKLNMSYNSRDEMFTLKFSDAEYGGNRTARHAPVKECRDIRIIADMSSIEVYLNGGETVLSTRFYPKSEKVSVEINGNISADIRRFK